MFPLNAVCNLGMAFGRQTASVEYKETSKDFRFYAKCSFEDKEPETLVLVERMTSTRVSGSVSAQEQLA